MDKNQHITKVLERMCKRPHFVQSADETHVQSIMHYGMHNASEQRIVKIEIDKHGKSMQARIYVNDRWTDTHVYQDAKHWVQHVELFKQVRKQWAQYHMEKRMENSKWFWQTL